MGILTPGLLNRVIETYVLPSQGIHGLSHWARVLENGRRLAPLEGADTDIVELFAVFHDACRMSEGSDRGHAGRGAQLARMLHGAWFVLDDARFALFVTACEEHTAGLTEADISIQVCWDADRLDLLRVGKRPKPGLLCTETAKDPEVARWANDRAGSRDVPALIHEEWKVDPWHLS